MKKTATLLDLTFNLILKFGGVYFLIKGELVNTAIMWGASGIWSISMVMGRFLFFTKNDEPKT